MTSIEIPYSIAAALPSLSVIDITNEVARAIDRGEVEHGVAFVSPRDERALVRVNEREAGVFEDFEALLARLVPCEREEREALLALLLGPCGSMSRSSRAASSSASGSESCSSPSTANAIPAGASRSSVSGTPESLFRRACTPAAAVPVRLSNRCIRRLVFDPLCAGRSQAARASSACT